MSRQLVAEKQKTLEALRSERVALAATLSNLAGEVSRAAEAARTAQLDAVIAPTRETQTRAEAAAKALEAVVARRDAAEDRAELLDLAAARLEAEIRQLDAEVRRAERAAAVVALTRKLDEGRAAARTWIIMANAAEMLRGTVVTDAGVAAIQALEPSTPVAGVIHSISASAAALRESVDRGEVL